MVSPKECKVSRGLFGEWSYVCPLPSPETKAPEPFPPASGEEWWGDLIVLEALRHGRKSNADDILRITEEAVSPEQAQLLSRTFTDSFQQQNIALPGLCNTWVSAHSVDSDFCRIYFDFSKSLNKPNRYKLIPLPSRKPEDAIPWYLELSTTMFQAGKNPFPAFKAVIESAPNVELIPQWMQNIALEGMRSSPSDKSCDDDCRLWRPFAPETRRAASAAFLASMSPEQKQALAEILHKRLVDLYEGRSLWDIGSDFNAGLELIAALAGERAPATFEDLRYVSTSVCRDPVTAKYNRRRLDKAYECVTGTPLIPFEEKAYQDMKKSWLTVIDGVVDLGTSSAGTARGWLSSFKTFYGIK